MEPSANRVDDVEVGAQILLSLQSGRDVQIE